MSSMMLAMQKTWRELPCQRVMSGKILKVFPLVLLPLERQPTKTRNSVINGLVALTLLSFLMEHSFFQARSSPDPSLASEKLDKLNFRSRGFASLPGRVMITEKLLDTKSK